MNFKIIKTGLEYPDVLVTRDRDDDGEIVKIIAIGTINDDLDQIIETIIEFPQFEFSKAFIENFNTKLAKAFCDQHNIKY